MAITAFSNVWKNAFGGKIAKDIGDTAKGVKETSNFISGGVDDAREAFKNDPEIKEAFKKAARPATKFDVGVVENRLNEEIGYVREDFGPRIDAAFNQIKSIQDTMNTQRNIVKNRKQFYSKKKGGM